jgi:dTDP-4-dehydrorhamnose 3,5-epimerase
MSLPFEFTSTSLPGLFRIERKPISDHRGFFSRFFCADTFIQLGFNKPIAQINHTLTRQKGSIRGLHYQAPPAAEIKIISCIQGDVFDVAVDLRRQSPSFLQWHAEILTAENRVSLIIPEGFAHGFQTLTEDCEMVYLHSVSYTPECEGAVNPFDPCVSVDWPLPVTDMSAKDRVLPMLSPSFKGIALV